jgi:uracil-DNA glycosylase family 4
VTCSFQSFSNAARFEDLVQSVQHCDICPRLCGRRKVLSAANGSLNSKVLFVAEAPGRLGADRTGIPLFGDRTGDNFETLLGNVSWRREDVFITNAVLCNPRQDTGNNGTPSADEVANCSAYLEMVIALVAPEVIVTLGATALDAVGLLEPHGVQLRQGVGKMVSWGGTRLFPLYHPGPRALIHRSLPKQRSDFMALAKLVHPVKGRVERPAGKSKSKSAAVEAAIGSAMQQIVRAILELGGQMAYFKLTKLMYLVDLRCVEQLGCTFASEVYLRQVDGPWAPGLDKTLRSMDGHEVRRFVKAKAALVALGPCPRFEVEIPGEVAAIVTEVVRKYGHMTNSQLKTCAYLTDPMKFILEQERQGKDMRNKAVLYQDKTARTLAPK